MADPGAQQPPGYQTQPQQVPPGDPAAVAYPGQVAYNPGQQVAFNPGQQVAFNPGQQVAFNPGVPYNPNQQGAPVAVAYNPGGMNPPVNVVQQVLQLRPEQFLTDYRIFSLVITILFGILGPISLITGIPAALLAYQGYEFMKKGMYEKSRTRSVISAYLSFGTMFLSIITTSLLACLLLGFRYSYS